MTRFVVLTATVMLALAGCGSGQETHLDTSPGAWSGGDQGTFIGACTASVPNGTDPGYCQCALEALEAVQPTPSGNLRDAGMVAGENATDKGTGDGC